MAPQPPESAPFPPTTLKEMALFEWDRLDVILLSGDAYVDHPAFGVAMIARVLMNQGFKVGVLPQPDWRKREAFSSLGRPRLFFGVTGGNVDSMVALYTPFRNKRRKDAYSPEGRTGLRPNRAALVYAQQARAACPGVPIVLGGVEAGMRRLSHYDFFEDRVRRSILLDAKADLILYGMAEKAVTELARLLDRGGAIEEARALRGSVFAARAEEVDLSVERLPDFERVTNDPLAFTESFRRRHLASDPYLARTVAEPYGTRLVVQNPPPLPLTVEELDGLYALPFTRKPHPCYGKKEIPALKTVQTSLVTHRGCFGGCSFCGIAFHQGRQIQSRSRRSVVDEAKGIARERGFKGTINDVGGPTANMYGFSCAAAEKGEPCKRPHCLFPKPCPRLIDGHGESVELLRSLRSIERIRHVFVQSGVRYDFLLSGPGLDYLKELVRHHVSGTLKVAPEHAHPKVLAAMRKPPFECYETFRRLFDKLNREAGLDQFLVSYFISAHPGCGRAEMDYLKRKLDALGLKPEQIQDYMPLPGTAASVMYHTGLDPFTDEPLFVAREDRERRAQRRMIQPD